MIADNIRPIRKGRINLTSGTYPPDGYVCQVDGSLIIKWNDNTTTVLAMDKGDTAGFSTYDCKEVTITTGTFMRV